MFSNAFIYLGQYLGGPGVVFLATFSFVVIVRVFIAFIFRVFRLNIDYHAIDRRTYQANARSRASEYHKKNITRV